GFARARPRGKDVENQLGAIHDALADGVLDVLSLRRRELVVEDHERRLLLVHRVAELVDLAGPEIGAGMRAVDLLRHLANDDGAGGVGQLRKLAQVIVHGAAGARPLERGAHEERPLDWRRNGDRSTAYFKILFIKLLPPEPRRREA